MATKFSVNQLSEQVHGVYASLKHQYDDALRVYEAKHDQCEGDAKRLAGGLTQAYSDVVKFSELNQMDTNTYDSRVAEKAFKEEALAER